MNGVRLLGAKMFLSRTVREVAPNAMDKEMSPGDNNISQFDATIIGYRSRNPYA
jgi:hypothetical protein